MCVSLSAFLSLSLCIASLNNSWPLSSDGQHLSYDVCLECAAAGDHVAAVARGIQACTEDGTVPQIIYGNANYRPQQH